MATMNKRSVSAKRTHQGAPAASLDVIQQLERTILACLLWEKNFYESGSKIADRIKELCKIVPASEIARIADVARNEMYLRHAPLLLAREQARAGNLEAQTLCNIIQRPDELTEFLSIYWMDGKCPLSAQVKKGLAKAFNKFDEYSLAKYNRTDKPVKLRDVLFLSHAKPLNTEQEEMWKRLVNDELATPDTWEVAISSGADKQKEWTRLLEKRKLGGLALLRNLRNMQEANVQMSLIKEAINDNEFRRVLPFRFIAASKFAPSLEPELEQAMFRGIAQHTKMAGKTLLLVDVSGSMTSKMSERSDLLRSDGAAGLTMLLREICDDLQIYSFSEKVVECPLRRGFALGDALWRSQEHVGTYLGRAVKQMNGMECDRLIVLTDEQSHDVVPGPKGRGYMINVASHENGVGYGPWTRVTGWSENIVRYILESEVRD